MRAQFSLTAGFVVVSIALFGCGDPSRPTDPSAGLSGASGPSASNPLASHSERLISMMDACDPTTFDTAIGPGTCLRQAGVTFANFIAQLTHTQKAGAWHFAPPTTTARVGQTLHAINRGGEVHTFTRVAAFGGGIVPVLNGLSGNPVVAPECTALEPDDFVAPGASYEEVVQAASTQRFQCCIHPWMRTIVHTH
jgi:plastocyanin